MGEFEPYYDNVGVNTSIIKTRIYRSQRILPIDSITVEYEVESTFTDAIVIPHDLEEQLPEVNCLDYRTPVLITYQRRLLIGNMRLI